MPSALTIRQQIEAALAHKLPSALTPAPKMIRPVVPTGVAALDDLLHGGLPVGAISELVGPECSGRTSVALSFLAGLTQEGKVCAWVDASNTLDPLSVAAAGVDLTQLLWVRCGGSQNVRCTDASFSLPAKYLVPAPVKKGLHGGGFGPHPRSEAKGLSEAVDGLLRPETIAPRCAEPQRRVRSIQEHCEPVEIVSTTKEVPPYRHKPLQLMDRALRASDLLLQAGGFSAVVLDMGGIAPEFVLRVPLATWFRYRAAAEKTQSSILLLTQYACTKSSGELLLRFHTGETLRDEPTVFTGIEHCVEIVRKRFMQTPSNVVPMRKPPQSVNAVSWQSRTSWAGRR